MTEHAALSLAYIDRQPLSAARTLGALPVAEAAAYLDVIPTRHAVAVLAHTGPWSTARLLAGMAKPAAAAALRGLPYLDAVAVLRMLAPAEREPLLGALPRRLRRDFEATLAYPSDTVGGRMSTDFVALGASHTVADARNALGEGPAVDLDVLFVTGSRRSFVGAVPTARLFRFDASVPLPEVIDPDVSPLSARQTLASAAENDAWRRFHWLPVIGRRGNLVGALCSESLRPARSERAPDGWSRSDGLLAALAGEYAAFGASLFELFSREGRSKPSSDDGGSRS